MIIKKEDADSIDRVSRCLKKNALVVLPTDTIYGFSAIAPQGASKILHVKGRDEGKSFIQLLAQPEDLYTYLVGKFNPALLSLWPGAVTYIVKTKHNTTTAFRCPGDSWLRSVIEKTGSPLYSTSVNRSGEHPFNNIEKIIREFGTIAECIVDAGTLPFSSASTIVDTIKGSVIRQGGVVVPEEYFKIL